MSMIATRNAISRFAKRAAGDAGEADGNDRSYEQALSDISDAILQDRAPAMKRYEVGFQLIDRDDDNERAIGVKMFRVGDQWMFAPIFFVKGRAKGADMLYLKTQDILVPLHEDWVRYLVNKKPSEVGVGAPRNLSFRGLSLPDLRSIVSPPNKSAAWTAADDREGFRVYAEEALPALQRTTDFPRFTNLIKLAGRPGVLALASLAEECPGFFAELERLNGRDALAVAIKEAATIEPKPAADRPPRRAAATGELMDALRPVKTGALMVVIRSRTMLGGDLLRGLDDDDRMDDDGDRVEIRDSRSDDESSAITPWTDAPRELFNPPSTGLYDVWLQPGEFAKCFVAINPRAVRGQSPLTLVVRVEDGAAVETNQSRIWVRERFEQDDWRKWYKSLPSAGSGDWDAARVYLGNNGDATEPLRITKSHGVSPTVKDGGRVYEAVRATCGLSSEASGHCGCGDDDDVDAQLIAARSGAPRDRYRFTINIGGSRGSRLWSSEGVLYIPVGHKALNVNVDRTISPASPMRYMTEAFKDLRAVKVAVWDGDVWIDDKRVPPARAVAELVLTHGLREKDAAAWIAEAEAVATAASRTPVAKLIKVAAPFLWDTPSGGATFPPENVGSENTLTGSVVAKRPREDVVEIPGMKADPAARDIYDVRKPNEDVIALIQNAARTGQREVVDTAAFAALTSMTQNSQNIDRHLGAIVAGMNAIGRIRVALYSNDESFIKRYGKNDVAALDDGLTDVFGRLGKLVLTLKQKGVEDPIDAFHGDFDATEDDL